MICYGCSLTSCMGLARLAIQDKDQEMWNEEMSFDRTANE